MFETAECEEVVRGNVRNWLHLLFILTYFVVHVLVFCCVSQFEINNDNDFLLQLWW